MNDSFALHSLRPIPRAYARFETLLTIVVLGYFGAALLNLVSLAA